MVIGRARFLPYGFFFLNFTHGNGYFSNIWDSYEKSIGIKKLPYRFLYVSNTFHWHSDCGHFFSVHLEIVTPICFQLCVIRSASVYRHNICGGMQFFALDAVKLYSLLFLQSTKASSIKACLYWCMEA